MKYKLLKELPGVPIGTEAELNYWEGKGYYLAFAAKPKSHYIFVDKNNIDVTWFEPLCEWPKSWKELQSISGYIICSDSNVVIPSSSWTTDYRNKRLYATEAHAKAALAFAQLSQIAKVMNDGWEPNWSDTINKYFIGCCANELLVDSVRYSNRQLVFKTKEIAEFSLKYHKQLWEDYWMIND